MGEVLYYCRSSLINHRNYSMWQLLWKSYSRFKGHKHRVDVLFQLVIGSVDRFSCYAKSGRASKEGFSHPTTALFAVPYLVRWKLYKRLAGWFLHYLHYPFRLNVPCDHTITILHTPVSKVLHFFVFISLFFSSLFDQSSLSSLPEQTMYACMFLAGLEMNSSLLISTQPHGYHRAIFQCVFFVILPSGSEVNCFRHIQESDHVSFLHNIL